MKKILGLMILAAAAALPTVAHAQEQAPAAAHATPGKMLYSADGKRIAAVYRVQPDGSPQVILSGKLVTVPASTLTVEGDKLTTRLTRTQLASSR